MPHGEFIKLLQMTEGYRACTGRDCHTIPDALVVQAQDADGLEAAHMAGDHPGTIPVIDCVGCEDMRQTKIALRETLHSQGVDLPVGVFET